MPPLDERLPLAEATMVGLAGDAQLPPKLGVHPRPPERFAHAMPAFLPGSDRDRGDDLLGMKWVVGFPGNGAVGLPAISALVLLDDPTDRLAHRHPRRHAHHRPAHGRGVRRGHRALRARRRTATGARGPRRRRASRAAATCPSSATSCRGCRSGRPRSAPGSRDGPRRASPAARPASRVSRRRRAARARHGSAPTSSSPPSRSGPLRQVAPPDWLAPDALVVAVDYATMVVGRRRPRRGDVPRRRARPVRGQPRERRVRRTIRIRPPRSARPSSPRRDGRPRVGCSCRTSASAWPTSSSATPSSATATASGSGILLPAA